MRMFIYVTPQFRILLAFLLFATVEIKCIKLYLSRHKMFRNEGHKLQIFHKKALRKVLKSKMNEVNSQFGT
jgi:hypothetical protein